MLKKKLSFIVIAFFLAFTLFFCAKPSQVLGQNPIWYCQNNLFGLGDCSAYPLNCEDYDYATCTLPGGDDQANELCDVFEQTYGFCPDSGYWTSPCDCAYPGSPNSLTPIPTPTPASECGLLLADCCDSEEPCSYPYITTYPTPGGDCVCQYYNESGDDPTDCVAIRLPFSNTCIVSPLNHCGDDYEARTVAYPDPFGGCACACFISGSADIYCPGENSVRTALGCIPVSIQLFTSWFLSLLIPAGGVVAFIVILYASFQLVVSAGDPQKIQNAKGLLTAALSGLVLVILAIFILRLIGIQLLSIPGF